MRLAMAVALAVLVALIASGCAVSGVQFRQDLRVEFETPGYREQVQLPVTVTWHVDDQLARQMGEARAGEPAMFGVMINREPQPPGEDLAYFARDDSACTPQDRCPDEDYLADRRVFTTSESQFHIETLPPAPGVDLDRGQRDLHEFTLVLLDREGRRVGESSWTQIFEVVRDR